jgi:hypothetical protein
MSGKLSGSCTKAMEVQLSFASSPMEDDLSATWVFDNMEIWTVSSVGHVVILAIK